MIRRDKGQVVGMAGASRKPSWLHLQADADLLERKIEHLSSTTASPLVAAVLH